MSPSARLSASTSSRRWRCPISTCMRWCSQTSLFDLCDARCDAGVQIELSLPWHDVRTGFCFPRLVPRPLAINDAPKLGCPLTERLFEVPPTQAVEKAVEVSEIQLQSSQDHSNIKDVPRVPKVGCLLPERLLEVPPIQSVVQVAEVPEIQLQSLHENHLNIKEAPRQGARSLISRW